MATPIPVGPVGPPTASPAIPAQAFDGASAYQSAMQQYGQTMADSAAMDQTVAATRAAANVVPPVPVTPLPAAAGAPTAGYKIYHEGKETGVANFDQLQGLAAHPEAKALKVAVVNPDGETRYMAVADLGRGLQQGYTLEDSARKDAIDASDSEYGLGNKTAGAIIRGANSAVLGGINSATFGASNAALKTGAAIAGAVGHAVGAEVPEQLSWEGMNHRLQEQYLGNETAQKAGELGGLAASFFLPMGAIAQVGKAATGLVGLGKATSVAGRLAGGVVAGAAEGAAIAAPSVVPEAIFGDGKQAAESLFWNVAGGAGIHTVLGGAGMLGRGAVDTAGQVANKARGALSGAGDKFLLGMGAKAAGEGDAVTAHLAEGAATGETAAVEGAAEHANGEPPAAGAPPSPPGSPPGTPPTGGSPPGTPPNGGSFRGAAEDAARKLGQTTFEDAGAILNPDVAAFRSLDPIKKFSKKAIDGFEGGIKEVGAGFRKLGIAREVGESSADVLNRIEVVQEKLGQEISNQYSKIDAALEGTEHKLNIHGAAIADRIESEVLPRLQKSPFLRGESSAVKDQVDNIREMLNRDIGLKELHTLRTELDKKIYGYAGDAAMSATKDEFSKIRGIITDELEKKGAEAAKKLDMPGWLPKLKELNYDYRITATGQKIAESAAAAEATNRALGLTDTIAGGSGAKIGAGIGGTIGGIPGAFVGGAIGGAVSSYGNRLIRRNFDPLVAKYGNQMREVAQNAIRKGTDVAADRVGNAVENWEARRAAGAHAQGPSSNSPRGLLGPGNPEGGGSGGSGGPGPSGGPPTGHIRGFTAHVENHGPDAGVVAGIEASKKAGSKIAQSSSVVRALVKTGWTQATPRLPAKVIANWAGMRHSEGMTPAKAYEGASKKVIAMMQNPEMLADHAASISGPISHYGAPNLASALTQQQIKVWTYLASTMPKVTPTGPFGGPPKPPSNADIAAWAHKIEVAQDPSVVLDALRDGTLTQSHIDAMRAMFPETYGRMVHQMVSAGVGGPAVPGAQRELLQKFTGMQSGVGAASLARLQATYANPGKSGLKTSPHAPARSLATSTQKLGM